jgi:hypothetical protein
MSLADRCLDRRHRRAVLTELGTLTVQIGRRVPRRLG